MSTCTKVLTAAVMGLSMSAFCYGEPAPAGGAADGLGNMAAAPGHEMARGGMNDADMKCNMQLDKIATMGEKAGDALFVDQVAGGNLFEIRSAQAVQAKSQDAKVKELAAMIEKDHTEANQKLMPIAQKMGLELPTELPSAKQKMLDIMGSMPPEKMETAWLMQMKADHAKDITNFADHEKAVMDSDLKAFIADTLPHLKEHGSMIVMAAAEKGYPIPMAGGATGGAMAGGMGGMRNDDRGAPAAGGGANSNPTNPANNQNPSNR